MIIFFIWTNTIFIFAFSDRARHELSFDIYHCLWLSCSSKTESWSTVYSNGQRLMTILKIAIIVKSCQTYKQRLEKLNLFSPARRRLRGEVILACNPFNGSFAFLMNLYSQKLESWFLPTISWAVIKLCRSRKLAIVQHITN